jgi:hypothetical protein
MSDIEMEQAQFDTSARWTVEFQLGNAFIPVTLERRAILMDGWFALFSQHLERNLRFLERGFAVPNQEPTSLTGLWEMILHDDPPTQLYFEGAIPLIGDREWCSVEGDILRNHIAVSTFHTGMFRLRLDVIYLWPKGHETVLMRERPLGLTIHGFVYHGEVSLN